MSIINPTRFVALTALIWVLLISGIQTATPAPKIVVLFKLDPSLTRGMYMGDRWASPPTYTTSQPGKTSTIEAKVESLDKGISPTWTSSDPKMVTVSPQQGHQVTITVLRAGQSTLKVAFEGASKTISIKAKYEGDAIQVEISQ